MEEIDLGGGGSQNPDKHTFNANWNTKEPLDVTKVEAIVINDPYPG